MIFEACVDSVESARAAHLGGARRVELCSGLLEGGLTPSAGMLEVARATLKIGIMTMIRPRGGDFLYTDHEFRAMCRDVEAAKAAGANGVVFGLLEPNGTVEATRTAEMVELARPLSVTFHRAFDMTRDPFEALETLIDLGVDRVLTSGQEAGVIEGLDTIAELARRAGDRIIVMPGGGITARNVARVAAVPGIREIHFGGGETIDSAMVFRNPRVFMGGPLRPPEYAREVQHSERVAELIAAAGDRSSSEETS
jgi:copper homeostasis protein